ncbi:hypothetical protein J3459_015278 [Metarhizium acridum]|uniref:uncharacterized protein n=1 Tax=Metarhizium acridum TaxID=92637 RepID=UPI001C6C2E9E|nr:hypothetical protein J3459_015278 [Metarhizium acridum]KAG8413997.1 hypothetical protein J3458_011651 [Metarhizium acridum]
MSFIHSSLQLGVNHGQHDALDNAVHLGSLCLRLSPTTRLFFDLAAVIRNDKKVQGDMKATGRRIIDGVLYSEIPLKDSKIKMDDVLEDERKCLYLHNFVKSEDASLDINPHADYPSRISGDEAIPLEITTSVAKINGKNQ